MLQQVQYVPEQTHVYSTTSFSPATKTTIYEQDHVAAYSAPKPQVVRAPVTAHVAAVTAVPVLRSPTPIVDERAIGATIYTFPKMRILGAPIRVASKLSSRRQLRQRLREERLKEKYKGREKKIFVFNRRNSSS